MVYKIKYKATGEVKRFKVRLIRKGYSQKEGIDYPKIFSPIVKMVTIKTVLSLAAAHPWNIYQMDIFNDFYKVI